MGKKEYETQNYETLGSPDTPEMIYYRNRFLTNKTVFALTTKASSTSKPN
ncbi:hypothetical protein [Candidatus Enterovibrio escicola]